MHGSSMLGEWVACHTPPVFFLIVLIYNRKERRLGNLQRFQFTLVLGLKVIGNDFGQAVPTDYHISFEIT